MSMIPSTLNHPQPVKKRKVRVFTWIILAINAIFAAWLIGGIASVSHQRLRAQPEPERL